MRDKFWKNNFELSIRFEFKIKLVYFASNNSKIDEFKTLNRKEKLKLS